MQEFLKNNIVNCNLMSLTGFRTLIILKLLIDSPKSNDEINEFFLNHQHIKENFSKDTLRIYINSLRTAGCEITRADKMNKNRYKLISHPFEYDIQKSQINALMKLYRSIYDKIELNSSIDLEYFFINLTNMVKSEVTKSDLSRISMLKNVNKQILDELLIHCKNKRQITILYNSPQSGSKKIKIIVDKIYFHSEKLYLSGTSLTHNQYSYFLVDRVLEICSTKLFKDNLELPSIKIIYELKNKNNDYILKPDEKIIKKMNNKLLIEAISKNEFSLMQRVLYMAEDCKVIEPEIFKIKLLNKLKNMEKDYEIL